MTLALFNCIRKYIRLEAFFMIWSMCIFHVRLLEIVTPSNLALSTHSSSWLFTTIGASCGLFFANEILSSLHFSLFSFTLFSKDHCTTVSAINWELLLAPFTTISDVVVSSTYFQILPALLISRSLMSTKNNHGPSFVPWGTPDGTDPHSE